MAKKKAKAKEAKQAANLGFEAKLWLAADKLRNNMDAAEYKHTVLGLIFLKYISDAFEEMHQKLVAGEGEYEGADPEDPDEHRAENRSKDILGRVYEYFLSQFASAEGKKGGQFYTPSCVVRAVARAGCSCSRKSSSNTTAAGSGTSRSTARSRIRPRGGWR
jgi:type I restriction-modification system DNA methylase subunit